MKTFMIVAYLSGLGMDGVTTHTALSDPQHRFHEAVMTQNPWVNDGIIVAQAVGGTWALNRIYKDHPKLVVGLGVALGALRFSVGVHNLNVRRSEIGLDSTLKKR